MKDDICFRLREVQKDYGRIIYPKNMVILTNIEMSEHFSNIRVIYCPTIRETTLGFYGNPFKDKTNLWKVARYFEDLGGIKTEPLTENLHDNTQDVKVQKDS